MDNDEYYDEKKNFDNNLGGNGCSLKKYFCAGCCISGLVAGFIALLMFGFFYLINNGSLLSDSGAIIPYASFFPGPITLFTNNDGSGDPSQVAFVTDGTALVFPVFTDKNFDIINLGNLPFPFDSSFSMPRNGLISSLAATFTTSTDLDFSNTDCQVSAQLFVAEANSVVFHALPRTRCDLNPRLNGAVPKNTVLTGSLDNLNITVKRTDKILMIFYLTSYNTSGIGNQNIQGFANAGLNIR